MKIKTIHTLPFVTVSSHVLSAFFILSYRVDKRLIRPYFCSHVIKVERTVIQVRTVVSSPSN